MHVKELGVLNGTHLVVPTVAAVLNKQYIYTYISD